jgi:hypothetical protein
LRDQGYYGEEIIEKAPSKKARKRENKRTVRVSVLQLRITLPIEIESTAEEEG